MEGHLQKSSVWGGEGSVGAEGSPDPAHPCGGVSASLLTLTKRCQRPPRHGHAPSKGAPARRAQSCGPAVGCTWVQMKDGRAPRTCPLQGGEGWSEHILPMATRSSSLSGTGGTTRDAQKGSGVQGSRGPDGCRQPGLPPGPGRGGRGLPERGQGRSLGTAGVGEGAGQERGAHHGSGSRAPGCPQTGHSPECPSGLKHPDSTGPNFDPKQHPRLNG